MSPESVYSSLGDVYAERKPASEEYSLLQVLKSVYSETNNVHLSVVDNNFRLLEFLSAKGISTQVAKTPKIELLAWSTSGGVGTMDEPNIFVFTAQTQKGDLFTRLNTCSVRFTYQETEFDVLKVQYNKGGNIGRTISTLYHFVFKDPNPVEETFFSKLDLSPVTNKTIGHRLISDIYHWASSLKDEIWVFDNGFWNKRKDLWKAVQKSSWDDLVLEPDFLDNLRRDTRTFFDNREIYQQLGVTWKRGLLMLGPPGNGKTETIKVLLKELKQNALYVKSFTTANGPESGVQAIFNHARANAPCILVIEDLDSLVSSDVRSFFLNELDGLNQNEGILTIATTNHPEKIDDAILNRPSRFDVKYNFDLPNESLRSAYILKWIRKITSIEDIKVPSNSSSSINTSSTIPSDSSDNKVPEGENRKSTIKFSKPISELSSDIVERTEGWSYAFLKELFVSFLLRMAHDKTTRRLQAASSLDTEDYMDEVLLKQVSELSAQILAKGTDDDTPVTKTAVPRFRQSVRAQMMPFPIG